MSICLHTSLLRLVACLTMAASLLVAPALAHAGSDGDDYVTDEQGRPIRVAFPLHDRLLVDAFVGVSGGAATARRPTGNEPGPAEVAAGGLHFAIQHSFGLDYPDEEIWWRFRHAFLNLEATVPVDGLSLHATLLEGTYLRHDEAAFIVVPSNVDLRFPAPFDLAVEYSLLGVELNTGDWTVQMLDVASFAFLLDFIRDPDYRHRLAIGPVAAYGMLRTTPVGQDAQWAHYFVPMTGGRFVYGWESQTGRFAISAALQCAAEANLVGEGLRWQRRCTADIESEWTLLALNDTPISLLLAASAGEPQEHVDADALMSWGARIGLRWSLPGGRG